MAKRPNTQMQMIDQQLNSVKTEMRAEKSKEKIRRKPELPLQAKKGAIMKKLVEKQ